MIDHNNLEEFADAVDYNIMDHSDTGVAFYSELARETGGPVLEIGCGTCRVSTGLDMSLFYNGFEVIREYGDWNLEPLNADSPSIIVVCRKRE